MWSQAKSYFYHKRFLRCILLPLTILETVTEGFDSRLFSTLGLVPVNTSFFKRLISTFRLSWIFEYHLKKERKSMMSTYSVEWIPHERGGCNSIWKSLLSLLVIMKADERREGTPTPREGDPSCVSGGLAAPVWHHQQAAGDGEGDDAE